MSRKSIFTVVGGAALGLLFAAGILWVELLAAEAEYVEEQEPVSPPVAEVIRQETPQEAAYTHKSTMTVTAYCPCEKCCGAYSNGYTATGVKATQGVTIATDPDVIPMGTEVEIDGHIYIAQDVGGAISGNRIQSMDGLSFTANYTLADYKTLKAKEGTEADYAVWFGGTETGGAVTPTGSDGKFSFKGQLSVYPTGGGVNEVVGMNITIAPTSVITLDDSE